jgi:chemotaxis protein CheD
MITEQAKLYDYEDEISYVFAGQVITRENEGVLYSTPLGSCIAVLTYDMKTGTGGMAHIMLPGKAPRKGLNQNRYAVNAINTLISKLGEKGVNPEKLKVCLIGGANVLRKQNDIIAKQLTDNVLKITAGNNLKIAATSLGGFKRRSAKLYLNTGIVTITIGNSFEKILYKFTED